MACTPGFSALNFFAWLDEVEPTWYSAVPTMHQTIRPASSVRLGVIWRFSEGVWLTGTLLQRAPELLTRHLMRESP